MIKTKTKKEYLKLKKELTDIQRFDLVSKLIDLYYDAKNESFSDGMNAVIKIYKK